MVAGLAEYFYWGLQAVAYASAGLLPLMVKDIDWREVRPVGSGPLLAVLRGLLISLPLLLLFVAADAVFENLVSNLFFDFDLVEVMGHLLLFSLFAWITAALLRVALIDGELPNPPGERPGFLYLGVVDLGISLSLLNLLFLSFVVVQVRYLFGGAGQVLASTGLTYAEYARRGFFELVTVTALVLPLLLAAHWVFRPAKPLHVHLFRLLSGSLVALLFVIIASALQRMRLYTEEFGLTELRLYTTAFMFWIAAVLVFFLLTVLRDRRRYFASLALVSGFAAIAVLNAFDPDALIVRTNVARLEAGKEFDVPYLASLSADAVPPLLAALPSMSEADRRTVEEELRRRWTSSKEDWRTFNLSRNRARDLIGVEVAGESGLARTSSARYHADGL